MTEPVLPTGVFSRAEERSIALLDRLLGWEIPPGVGWAHALGAAALTVLALQGLTGFLLGLYYSPATDTAWESVRYIQEHVTAGRYTRGLHFWGASGLVVLLALHLVRVFVWGAYKPPRQWTWVTGVGLMLLVLAAGFTGYLLPWDLKAYFATQVGAEIAGSVPLVGGPSRLMMLGGETIGNLTLTRFYVVHIVLLPISMVVLLALHLAWVRRHGIAPSGFAADEVRQAPAHFFPDHTWREAAAGVAVVSALSVLAWTQGAPLEAKADPSIAGYVPRPEWYFLPLFQLLRYFEGPWSFLASAVIPGFGVLGLLLGPWLDRGPERELAKRLPVLIAGAAAGALLLLLLAVAIAEAPRPFTPSAPPPPLLPRALAPKAASQTGSAANGQRLYTALACARCHEGAGRVGPDFSRVGSRLTESWMRDYLRSPRRLRWKDVDVRPLERMPDFGLAAAEAADLVSYLASRQDGKLPKLPADGTGGETAVEGKRLFEDYKCLGCHRLSGRGVHYGPDLTDAGLKYHGAYLRAFLAEPEAFLPGTPMRKLELWPEEVTAVTAYLETLRPAGTK